MILNEPPVSALFFSARSSLLNLSWSILNLKLAQNQSMFTYNKDSYFLSIETDKKKGTFVRSLLDQHFCEQVKLRFGPQNYPQEFGGHAVELFLDTEKPNWRLILVLEIIYYFSQSTTDPLARSLYKSVPMSEVFKFACVQVRFFLFTSTTLRSILWNTGNIRFIYSCKVSALYLTFVWCAKWISRRELWNGYLMICKLNGWIEIGIIEPICYYNHQPHLILSQF